MQSELRKYKDLLIVTGTGVIIFSLWSAVKVTLQFILLKDLKESLFAALDGMPEKVLTVIILALFILIIFAVHLHIGLGARSEGFGKEKRKAYLGLAIFVAFFYIVTIIFDILNYNSYLSETKADSIVTAIIDITMAFILIELVVSAFRVRRLTKRIRREEAAECS